ncbi:DUF1611 domain-containing protein [candidate division KSB1 bacterium]|nr:DUF1611 domain-containing protein [candidate division KSB1 bacterium]
MTKFPKEKAIVYCEGAFNTPNGKTAHGLVRKTSRYQILSVVDSRFAGKDAGFILDRKSNGIPIFENVPAAIEHARARKEAATHLVVGLAPDGGRLNSTARNDVIIAIKSGLNVDCGLHDFLSEDPVIAPLAAENNVTLRDIRKPPDRKYLHFFSGIIEQVKCLKIAVLGTDSAVGKRTTAWMLADGLNANSIRTEFVGTGQTAWMQGARYFLILDSLVNDFLSGEIEFAIWSAWNGSKPQVIVIEGQGSLMNPAYPGGYEILAAGRPDIVVLQHAPARKDYDGFPGYPIQPIEKQIQAIEVVSSKRVVAITVNHEDLAENLIEAACDELTAKTGLPAVDVLTMGTDKLVKVVRNYLKPNGTSNE